jgi:hypothetical protein
MNYLHKVALALLLALFFTIVKSARVTLSANSAINTYTLIANTLGNGKSSEETPDCAHPSFGPHITQPFDTTLKRDVFAFSIHVTPDNDGCSNFDRQRNEIKTFDPSPEYLKGRNGETVTYSWNFKLDKDFKPSKSFTHIHQIKAKGGDDGSPVITIIPRFGTSANKLELIHIDSAGTTTKVKIVDLAPFLGQWVHVKEKLTYGSNGQYSIQISTLGTSKATLFEYSNNKLDLWRNGAEYMRPKWGIYRSLNDKANMRDEIVYFDSFCLAKGSDTCK